MARRTTATPGRFEATGQSPASRAAWRDALPVGQDSTLTLREVRLDDAPSLKRAWV